MSDDQMKPADVRALKRVMKNQIENSPVSILLTPRVMKRDDGLWSWDPDAGTMMQAVGLFEKAQILGILESAINQLETGE